MELRSADQILIELCDYFDTLIAPRTLTRSNTNIIYLILKACAKGVEVINSICYQVSLKFDPYNCSDEDLISTAKLVGTAPRSGTVSALEIRIRSADANYKNLPEGDYTWVQSDTLSWTFTLGSSLPIPSVVSQPYATVIATSSDVGQFPLQNLTLTDAFVYSGPRPEAVPSGVRYMLQNNANRLGLHPEKLTAFRKRLATDVNRQRTLDALEEDLRKLPYVFDVKLYFNATTTDVRISNNWQVKPYHLIIFYSGAIKNEVADILASYSLFPTTPGNGSPSSWYWFYYYSSALAGGTWTYYAIPFYTKRFYVMVYYTVDKEITSFDEHKAEMDAALVSCYNAMKWVPYIEGAELQNCLDALGIPGINILSVRLNENNNWSQPSAYIKMPIDHLPYLNGTNYTEDGVD